MNCDLSGGRAPIRLFGVDIPSSLAEAAVTSLGVRQARAPLAV